MDKLRPDSEQGADLAESSPLFQSLVAQSPSALQVFDPSGRTLFANPATVALFGHAPESDEHLLSECQDAASLLPRVLAGETVCRTTTLRRGDGVLAVEITLFPLRDGSGGVSHIGASYKNVTGEAEARRGEGEQRRSHEWLTALLHSMTDGVIATDTDGRITRMNRVAEQLTGWPSSEAEGRRFEEVFRPIDSNLHEANGTALSILERGRREQHTCHAELAGRKGQRFAISCTSAPIRGAEGGVVGVVLVFRDVGAERQAAQEQEKLSRERVQALERLQHVLEGMPIACVVASRDLAVEYSNSAASKMLGQPASALMGELSTVAIGQPSQSNLHKLRLGEASSERRVSVRRANGDVSICDWYLTPLLDPNRQFAGAIFMGVDATSQAQAEARLRSSERRYRSLVQTTSSVVWAHDAAGCFVVPQADWQRYTGQSWQEQRGLGWMNAIHPDDRDQALSAWRRALEARSPYEVEGRIFHHATHTHRYFVARAAPIRGEGDVINEWIGTLTDVDDRKRARDEMIRLEAQNREMQQASRLKSEFLANMSHELRTPLNAILGFAELLADHLVEPGSPRQDEFVGYILSSGRHLLQLINDVLDLAKVEAGKLEFFPERVVVGKVVCEVCAILRSTSVDKGVHVTTDIPSDFPEANVDPARLKQVLFNYLSNALKFTPRDGNVVVRVRREGETHFRLEVQDDGIGVAPENQPRLFLEFQQLDPGTAKKHGGTGLGLALTKRLVEAQGGSVGVDSQSGHGSTFWASLPFDAARFSAPPPPPPRSLPADAARVLVVEDDAEDARLMSKALQDDGYAVTRVRTLSAAVHQCSAVPFDAITLDLTLPDGDGLTLLEELRDSALNRRTPVVVTTRSRNRMVSAAAVREVLYKPLDAAKLRLAMGRVRAPREKAMRVLVVEDDVASQHLMEAALEQLNCECRLAPNANAALQLATQAPPDCIVLDLMLPDMSGTDLLARLRALPECRETPVFIWTMRDLGSEEQAQLLTLAHGVLTKGDVTKSSLIAQLSSALPQRAR